MDFKNLCQHIDVDSIRAKIPQLPSIPAMPQIKLPKSMPKLRSRRIFKSSREDISKTSPKSMHQLAAPAIPPSEFINHSPHRISTISSLINQGTAERNQSTYCSADSIDDDYPTARQIERSFSKPIILSPINADSPRFNSTNQAVAGSSTSVKMSLTEKLQKGYKDFSEFRIKHIFAKKTVVRKDDIEVDHYVQRYNEDREREQRDQEKRDRKIAENYRFKFKVSRQNTGHTNSLSSNDSPVREPKTEQIRKAGKSVSDDESGMEASPPQRKDGISATRFSKVRNPLLHQNMSEDSNADVNIELEEQEVANSAQNQSALWAIKDSRAIDPEQEKKKTPSKELKSGGYKERIRRLTTYVSSHEESADADASKTVEATSGGAKILSKIRSFGKRNESEEAEATTGGERKRKAPLTPQQSEEKDETKTDNPMSTIKQNFKRFQKSMKRQQSSAATDESEDEDTTASNKDSRVPTKTEKLTARLRRFKSREASLDDVDNASPKRDEANKKSPLHTAISNKLQTWKKSFKKKPAESGTNTGDESSPEKQKRPDTFMNKLKYIRSRKNPNSADELDADDEDVTAGTSKPKDDTTARKPTNLEERFEQARQKTMKKVNEKMQQMKFFHKSQENIDKETNTKKTNDTKDKGENDSDDEETTNIPPTIARRSKQDDYQYNSEQEDIEEITNIQQSYASQKTRAVWTTKNILSDSMESETDSEFPRVLIHQDNSDLFESTLIIAVTRPTPVPMSPTPKISEITPEKYAQSPSPKPVEWISNTEIISSFLDITPPPKRKQSLEAILPPPRGHVRKLSMDSNSDSDSWMTESVRSNKQTTMQSKEGSRRTSAAGLNSIDEKEEPWKVHSKYREEKLYKAKSIDIFEANAQKGGVSAAFEDFDDELKNAPIVRIASHLNIDSFERDSSEELDAADDDNSSRVTKILVEAVRDEQRNIIPTITETKPPQEESQTQQQIGNSRESLIANFDENEEMDSGDDEDNRPPSAAPSPPPSHSPPPPPLPQRQPSIRLSKMTAEAVVAAVAATAPLPPLPKSKPPLPPHKPQVAAPPPPKIPERTASMSRIAKPLVKTSSLRLAYNEQVKPADVGKVNKLISRFEQPQTKVMERPRLIPRRVLRADDSDDYSDDYDDDDEEEEEEDDDEEENENEPKNVNKRMERDTTPTPTNTPRTNSVESEESLKTIYAVQQDQQPQKKRATATISNSTVGRNEKIMPTLMTTTLDEENNQKSPMINMQKATLNLDRNSNLSRPSSEYGSPLEYPSSLIGSTETTPIPDRKQQQQLQLQHQQNMRSRRSMTRDDEKFLSFDSDEENSYYSISSSGSSRYIVEI